MQRPRFPSTALSGRPFVVMRELDLRPGTMDGLGQLRREDQRQCDRERVADAGSDLCGGRQLQSIGGRRDAEADRRIHQGLELPLSLYRRDHPRQHLRNGPAGASQELLEDLRPTRCRYGRRHRGHAYWRSPRARCLPNLLFHRDPNHGRRRRRGGNPVVDRLFGSCTRSSEACSPTCCHPSCSAA